MRSRRARSRSRERQRRAAVPRAPTWRNVSIGAGLLLAGAVAILAWRSGSAPMGSLRPTSVSSPARPNVLLVSIDTLRADYLGTYGGTEAATPALDRIAAEGVVFERAVSHAPLTLPSHASLFTSRIPPAHGVRDNATYRLHRDQTTLAETLRAAGYATGAFVGAFVLDARFGLDQGFDLYDDDLGGTEEAERRADEVLASAAAWIERAPAGSPWFVFVHLFDPHAPYEAPEPLRTSHRANPYAGEVAFVDAAVAGFVERLRSTGRLDDTLVVITADHGEALGEHGERTHGMFAYDSTLRVPLLMRWPREVPRGERISSRVRLIDVAPTVLELTRVPLPESFEGRSLTALISGRENEDRTSYFEALTYSFNRGTAPLTGLYRDPYKLVSLPLPELYDLSADPGEETNLAATRARKLGEMAEALEELISSAAPSRETSRIPKREIDAGALERMHALGYIVAPREIRGLRDEYGPEDDPKRWVHLANKLDDAVNHHRAGRLDEASRLLREILAEKPTVATASARLARVLDELGRREEAIEILEEAFRRGVHAPSVVSSLGRLLSATGRPGRWVEVLESVVQSSPSDVEALGALASALGRMGRHEEAAAHLEKIVELDPENAVPQLELGLAYLRSGRSGEAEAVLRIAVEREPSLGAAWSALGDLYASRDEMPRALEAWRRAVHADPAQYETLARLGLALADAGRREDAIELLERFAEEAPAEIYGEDKRRARELAAALRRELTSR